MSGRHFLGFLGRTKLIIMVNIILLLVFSSIVNAQVASETAIIAVRSSSVFGLGHIGVGYQNTNDNYLCGAIEGKDNNPSINPGDDNGAWIKACDNIEEVQEEFRSRGYDKMKLISSDSYYPDSEKAGEIIQNDQDGFRRD